MWLEGTAVFSDCNKYRYTLDRKLGGAGQTYAFMLLNPSTATATEDDPTIRRCIGFATRERASHLRILNLFAYRSTDPKKLRKVDDPIGPENDDHIETAAKEVDVFVIGWGSNAANFRDRELSVLEMLHEIRGFTLQSPVLCLGQTKGGHPKHPLYLASKTTLRRFGRERLKGVDR